MLLIKGSFHNDANKNCNYSVSKVRHKVNVLIQRCIPYSTRQKEVLRGQYRLFYYLLMLMFMPVFNIKYSLLVYIVFFLNKHAARI